MILAEVVLSNEAIALVGVLVSTLVTAVVFLFKLLSSVQESKFQMALKHAEDQKKSYKEIAEEAVRIAEGKLAVKVKPIAPVVPEHNSPATKEQHETAELQTLRARITAVTLAEGLPARTTETITSPPVAAIADLKEDIKEVKEALKEIPAKTAELIRPE